MGMDARAHGGQLVYTINDQQAALQLQQQRRQANAVKSSRGLDRGNEQQLTLCEQHRIPLQLSEAPQSRHQQLFLVSRSHRDYALRRVASTGSTLNSSRYNYGTAPSSQPTDLLARMAELNRVAESTYNTTQQNGVCLSQQLRARRKA
ncbi:hypothetical protein PHYSODRAFT_354741 [Phytophthora sojae]|uniref:Uncharacterized protein n=1 Tax=Phytophthora sojae (strain P6497) TaxID=1094619 RepID=G4ZN01_PHYSP|nr:hypothetical protein PHYSODRAFT_354741 [Phytophthora sojae]EGZ15030.1 hypothetical protein PHYSODRAFT_354741 [Phytophthora sojae]|eukprot:XP_009528779.1 hypothetical protein PHYSODRAFT_354741 [Phytophthora sojae]